MLKNTDENLILDDFWVNVVEAWGKEAQLPDVQILETLEFMVYSGSTPLACYGAANNITMVYVKNIKKVQNEA